MIGLGTENPRTGAASEAAAKIAFLLDPSSYPDRPSRVTVIETHFAWVFLAGARAYKLKKASHLRGADWRTSQAREHACREELRLNRQISALTYLGVEPLVSAAAGLQIGGEGTAVDWLLVMQRLDERRMLEAVLTAGTLTPSDLDAVLQFLVNFYKSRPPLPFTPETYLRRVAGRMEESLRALEHPRAALERTDIERVAGALRTAFASRKSQLGDRAARHHIVEGHGDLRAEHVWLGPPVQIIDALEVYGDLRMLDTAEEVAVLALECERHRADWAANHLRGRYRALAADPCCDELFEFYIALRAINQAKLAIWHLDDPDQYPQAAPWRERARSAIAGALRHCSTSGAAFRGG
jgi:aminoglycoside phosphotransferase family enzyme